MQCHSIAPSPSRNMQRGSLLLVFLEAMVQLLPASLNNVATCMPSYSANGPAVPVGRLSVSFTILSANASVRNKAPLQLQNSRIKAKLRCPWPPCKGIGRCHRGTGGMCGGRMVVVMVHRHVLQYQCLVQARLCYTFSCSKAQSWNGQPNKLWWKQECIIQGGWVVDRKGLLPLTFQDLNFRQGC